MDDQHTRHSRSDAAHLVRPPTFAPRTPLPVGSWHLDVASQQLSWDETSAHLLGRMAMAQHLSTADVMKLWIHHDDRLPVQEGWALCAQTATPHRVRFRSLLSDGSYRGFTAYGRRIVTVDGGSHLVGVLHRDDTGR